MALLPSGIAKTGVVPFQIYPKTIDQSLRFEEGDNPKLEWSNSNKGTPTDSNKFTFSGWVKRGEITASVGRMILGSGTGTDNDTLYFWTDDTLRFEGRRGGTTVHNIATVAVFRDPSAWYHIVVSYDADQAFASDRLTIYVNGEQQDLTTSNEVDDGRASEFSESDRNVKVGTGQYGSSGQTQYFDGYMAELHFVDGTSYTADAFGELRSGIWVAKEPSVTYGNNGWHLDFSDSADLGNNALTTNGDNDFDTVSGLVASDVVPDSPTNNFCTLNPLKNSTTLKEGNLKNNFASNAFRGATSTFAIDSGKWYWEASASGIEGIYCNPEGPKSGSALTYPGDDSATNRGIGVRSTGRIYVNNALSLLFSGYSSGDVIGFALDADNDTLRIYLDDGTLDHTVDISDPHGDASAAKDMTQHKPYFVGGGTVNGGSQILNFGQDDTFAGTKTSVGNSDANGIGSFKHTVPSGYLALCTSNLPDPAIDPAQEATADQYFNVYTYTGNGKTQLIGDVVREIPDTYPISQSLRFEDGDSAHLVRTPTSNGSRTTFTWSGWVKRGNLGADLTQNPYIFGFGSSSGSAGGLRFDLDDQLKFLAHPSYKIATTRTFADPSEWLHIVIAVDTTQASVDDAYKLWVNGIRITDFSEQDNITLVTPQINETSYPMAIGRIQYSGAASNYWDGYMAEIHFVDGTTYEASDFGVFDADGLWRPIEPTVTYGTNGFYLPFGGGSDFSGYFDGTGDYLSFSNAVFDFGTSEDYSVEMFVKFNNVPSTIGFAGGYANSTFTLNYASGNLTVGKHFVGTQLTASTSFSVGQWYHIVACRESGTLSLFLDGTRLATTSDSTGYTAIAGNIGTDGFHAAVNGYISNARVLTGASAYDPTSTSLTVPTAALTAITNTELLTCQNGTFVDNSTNAYTITANGDAVTAKVSPFALDYTDDHSGEGNTWTFNNIVPSDVVSDSPTNQFATISSVERSSDLRSYEGNLATSGSLDAWRSGRATTAVRSGKWYWEVISEYSSTFDERGIYGVANDQISYGDYLSDAQPDNSVGAIQFNGTGVRFYGTNSLADQTDTTFVSASDVFNFAFDADNGDLYCGRNGVWYNSGDPAAGTGATNTNLDVSNGMAPAYSHYGPSGDTTGYWNFGQDSTFAGNKTAASNADANGYGEFQYAPPSGFLALCENNLIQYDDNPLESPDLVWIKNREQPDSHRLYDSVRGATESVRPNNTGAETTETEGLTAFGKNGFTIGDNIAVNTSGEDYVAWAWKAGGTAVANTDGSINSQVSANTDAGFSIVSYTGLGSPAGDGSTIGHGLNQAPELVIFKTRDIAASWFVMGYPANPSFPNDGSFLVLNDVDALGDSQGNEISIGDSVITLVDSGDSIGHAGNMIAYCFHSVDGFSKVGSYVGNGVTNGAFVYTGFRPKWIMAKRSDSSVATSDWYIWDSERNTFNVAGKTVQANEFTEESDSGNHDLDILSNGFKLRIDYATVNGSGNDFIYLAFAEQPFKYSNAR